MKGRVEKGRCTAPNSNAHVAVPPMIDAETDGKGHWVRASRRSTVSFLLAGGWRAVGVFHVV